MCYRVNTAQGYRAYVLKVLLLLAAVQILDGVYLYFVAHYGKLLTKGEGCAVQTLCA